METGNRQTTHRPANYMKTAKLFAAVFFVIGLFLGFLTGYVVGH